MLLDTHALLWLVFEPAHLSPAAQMALSARSQTGSTLIISAASFWELAVKCRKRKITLPVSVNQFAKLCQDSEEFEIIETAPEQWIRAAELDWIHKDPIDRLLVALADELACPIVTKDASIQAYHKNWIW